MAALLTAGCATTAWAPAAQPDDRLEGRIAVSVAADPARGTAAQQTSGQFQWRGDAERGELDLVSPLGVLVAKARWVPGEAVLDDGVQQRRYPSADALAQAVFGEELPVAALHAWLHGRPWSQAPAVNQGAGRFTQLGWDVTVEAQAPMARSTGDALALGSASASNPASASAPTRAPDATAAAAATVDTSATASPRRIVARRAEPAPAVTVRAVLQ